MLIPHLLGPRTARLPHNNEEENGFEDRNEKGTGGSGNQNNHATSLRRISAYIILIKRASNEQVSVPKALLNQKNNPKLDFVWMEGMLLLCVNGTEWNGPC